MLPMPTFRKPRRWMLAGLGVVLLLTSTAMAQSPDSADSLASMQTLPPGTKIRVTSLASQLHQARAQIVRWQGDTIILRPRGCDAVCDVLSVPMDSIEQIEVYAGRSAGKGAVIGALAGLLAGSIYAGATTPPDRTTNCGDQDLGECVGRVYGQVIGQALGGAAKVGAGVLVGALIGGAIGAGERYRNLPIATPSVSVGLLPGTPRGVAVTVSVAF